MVPGGVYALTMVWGPLGGGERGKLKAAPKPHSLDALGGWRICRAILLEPRISISESLYPLKYA